MAKWAGASRIFTTVAVTTSPGLPAIGADRPILYRTEDFQKVIKEETNGQGVHLVLDMVGGDYIAKHLRVLALTAAWSPLPFSMRRCELDWTLLMIKRLTFTGSTLRARSNEEKAASPAPCSKPLARAARGHLRPSCMRNSHWPMWQGPCLMESSQHVGKIVLSVNP